MIINKTVEKDAKVVTSWHQSYKSFEPNRVSGTWFQTLPFSSTYRFLPTSFIVTVIMSLRYALSVYFLKFSQRMRMNHEPNSWWRYDLFPETFDQSNMKILLMYNEHMIRVLWLLILILKCCIKYSSYHNWLYQIVRHDQIK